MGSDTSKKHKEWIYSWVVEFKQNSTCYEQTIKDDAEQRDDVFVFEQRNSFHFRCKIHSHLSWRTCFQRLARHTKRLWRHVVLGGGLRKDSWNKHISTCRKSRNEKKIERCTEDLINHHKQPEISVERDIRLTFHDSLESQKITTFVAGHGSAREKLRGGEEWSRMWLEWIVNNLILLITTS